MDELHDFELIENDRLHMIRLPRAAVNDLTPSETGQLYHLVHTQLLRTMNCARDEDKRRAYQYRPNPPCYIIFSGFEGIKKLVDELGMPNGPDDMYYSVLKKGAQFVNATDGDYRRYQEYTIELFGLRIKAPTTLNGSFKRAEPPDPSGYAHPPTYWYESPRELIQIWRTRIFFSKPQDLGTSSSDPVSRRWPSVPYLEKTWQPNRRLIQLRGMANAELGYSLFDCFFPDGLHDRSHKKGRPPGSGRYPTRLAFYEEVRRVFSKLWAQKKRRPSQAEVAFGMSLKDCTFKWHWSRTRCRWRDMTVE